MKTTLSRLNPEISEAIKKAFLDSMDESYSLAETGDINYYEEDPKSIQDCLDQKSRLPIDDNQWQADSRYHGSLNQLEELKSKILKNSAYKVIHPFITAWLADEENESLIIDTIEEKDISEPVKEMVERTKLRGRATLFTNYVFLSSNSDLKNTYEYDEYLKDIVDMLCLNPATVKVVFNEKGIHTMGIWPEEADRNGKEAVLYTEFADELLNQHCGCLFTFIGMLPLKSLYANDFQEIQEITIPKGNRCGMFNSWDGCGSLMEMELLRDLTVPVNRTDSSQYDKLEICVDERRCDTGQCIDKVYGFIASYWKQEFRLTYKSPKIP
ncbi:hypothetical protein [Dysgonomonas sp. ZJ709]|uniref:hypothetical protein n=1 Tax=Dysgonomonas sp. ZJ709 TaxID=2709797 RepID=UPI0013EB1359|nr:hypothetical protein [Dysgonomonas sp. ZJ709]